MRRSILCAAIAAGLFSSAALADWPQFLGPDRTGVSTETGLAHNLADGAVKPLWTTKVGAGYGGAAIRDGQVFILDREGEAKDVVRCLDLKTGKELWSFAYDAPGKVDHDGSRSTPAVDDKYVFTAGAFGQFYCIDRATHKPLWNKNLLSEYDAKAPGWACAQSPLFYKDLVIVAPMGNKAGVVAFEKATGKAVWQSQPVGKLTHVSPMIVKIGDSEQVVTVSNNVVTGVDASNGNILWSYNGWRCAIPIPNVTPIGDGRLFITGGYRAGSAMIKIESEGGKFTAKQLFKVAEHGAQIPNALLINKHLYFNGNTNETADGLICMDLDGKVLWQTKKKPYFERGNMIAADGVIYMLDGTTGQLRSIEPSPEGYKELSCIKVLGGSEIWAPLALSDGKLVIRDQSQMKCLDLKAQ